MTYLEQLQAEHRARRAVFYPATPRVRRVLPLPPPPAPKAFIPPAALSPREAAKAEAARLEDYIRTLQATLDADIVRIERVNTSRAAVRRIQLIVCRHYGIAHADMISDRRTANVTRPRQIAVYFAKCMTGKSLPEIGRHFGGRDHTTVLHAVRKIAGLRAADPKFAAELDAIAGAITAGVE